MRFFHQVARRAAVLLLCLSMLTGMLVPAFAATVNPAAETPEPTAATAFTVNAAGSITKYTGSDDRIVIPKAIDGKTITAIGKGALDSSKASAIVIPSTVKYVYSLPGEDYLKGIYFYGECPTGLDDVLLYTYYVEDTTLYCKSANRSGFEGLMGLNGDWDEEEFIPMATIKADLEDPAYPETPAHNLVYTDNQDGTHSAKCTDEGCDYTITNEPHTFVKGVCVCGAKIDSSLQEYYNFELRDGKAWIIGYKGLGGEITLPTTYVEDGTTYEVVGVAENAFNGNGSNYDYTDAEALSEITKITVPASIKTVEKCGFYYVGRYQTRLWQLKEIVFEAEDVTFGTAALGGNPNLTTVKLPEKLTAISGSMFADDPALAELTIPATVTSVGDLAFSKCTGLKKVTFLSETPVAMVPSVTSYPTGKYPFAGCEELIVYVPVVAMEDYQEAWSDMLAADTAKKGDITLAAWGEEPVVASIPDFKVYVEGTTAESEDPKYLEFHVTSFDNATRTGNVELKYVGYNSPTLALYIPETVTSKVLGRTWTFTVTGIGENAMFSYEMTGASSNYWFLAVAFPATLEYIAKGGCWSLENVRELDLSNTKVHTIGTYAFYGCSTAVTVKLPKTLEKMGTESSTITIGDGEAKEEFTYTENVFACCDSLVNIFVDAENPNFKDVDGILYTKDGKKLIRYPNARPTAHFDIPEGVEVIASQAFMQSYRGGSVLETVSFPSTLKSIESLAFRQSNLTSVTLPPHTTFGTSVFDISKKLASVTIPEGVEALGDYMFWSCEALTEIAFPDSLKTVGESCFGYTGLKKIDLNKVESLGSYAFYVCRGLTEIAIPATANEIGTAVFANDTNIEKVTFADGCKTIGAFMFSSNYALTDLTLADSIESVGEYAFSYCVGLSEVTMPKSLKDMGEAVFYKAWKNLTKVVFPDEVQITTLPASTFESCQALTYVYLGKNIIATAPVSLYDTNKSLIVDCAVANENFTRSPFDVYPYDLDNKALFVKYEVYNEDENHYPIYKVWLTDDGVSGGCGGGSGQTEDGYVVALIYAGATPEFRFGTEKPTEPVVLTVYERYEGESAVVAKTYTLSELKALAQTEVVGYQHWKNGNEKVIASNLYATVSSLLADAGVEFGAGDAVTAADPTDFTSTLTYEDSSIYKYYVNEDGATEVPAAILISWNTGSGTPEDVAKTAYISGSLRFAYGITEQQYADQSAQGKRLASNVVTLTVTHPERVVLTVYEQDEGGEAKEVKSYKPSELAALATEGTAGYQFWKKGEAQLVAATQYVTMNDLLTDAGITFADLDTLTAAAADGFSSELTYADNEAYRYYITEDGKTEVPAILALTWASGSGTLEEVAAAAKNTGNLRFCYGISEQQYADKSAAGKRLASNIATITVVHGTKAEEPWVNPFRDVTESDWFYDDVRFANQNGLFNGVEKDLFAPEEPMTRGMLVTVLWRLDGKTAPKAATTFTDVDVNAYYADAVAWAAESGVVNGIGGNKFDPEGNVTREQIAAILFRYAAFKGVDTAARADLTTFPDAEKTSAYAQDALSWAVAAALVNGTKEGSAIYLDPQGSATRAQVAAILSRYVQNIVK